MGRKEPALIGTTLCQTNFGWVGIAWSEHGLVTVTLPRPTETEASSLLPVAGTKAPETPPGLDSDALADKLRRYFAGETIVFDEPLDPNLGTSFQRRVWTLTRGIARGQTRTYGMIAREAGSPRASRAVGQCMARNPWPVIVPCHRVIGQDGRLTGFGGGLEMKRRMLEMEGVLLPLTPP